MKNKKVIFVIDDEKDIREILYVNLVKEGYSVYCFPSAEEADKKINTQKPDLIILDIMMEGIDGYEFCKQLRASDKNKLIPIIFLSAKSDEFDKVLGLELGGDDYITKPFGIKELKSRVKALLRRSNIDGINKNKSGILIFKGIELNPEQFLLKVDGKNVPLTKTEFEILYLFLTYPDKIFSRDNIIDSIKGENVYVVDRTIDVHIMNMRKKLGTYKNVIKTFSGVGYGFRE